MSGDKNISDILHSDAIFNKYRYAEKEITLDGGTGSGAIGTVDLFTVTGTVIARVIAICSTDVAGATATLEVGVAGGTADLIAQTLGTDIDSGEIWHDASPDKPIELSSVGAENIIANGADIILTVGTANATGGVLKFFVIWKPVSQDGDVEAA